MKFAFCFFRYFPYGGLQRDFLQIARAIKKLGGEIHVYTYSWEGEVEKDFNIHLLKVSGLQNHTRNQSFIKKLDLELKKTNYDLVIGFDPMPFLDVYYAAAACYQSCVKADKSFFYKILPRFRAKIG